MHVPMRLAGPFDRTLLRPREGLGGPRHARGQSCRAGRAWMVVAVPPPRYEGHEAGAGHARQDCGDDEQDVHELAHGGHDGPGDRRDDQEDTERGRGALSSFLRVRGREAGGTMADVREQGEAAEQARLDAYAATPGTGADAAAAAVLPGSRGHAVVSDSSGNVVPVAAPDYADLEAAVMGTLGGGEQS